MKEKTNIILYLVIFGLIVIVGCLMYIYNEQKKEVIRLQSEVTLYKGILDKYVVIHTDTLYVTQKIINPE